MILFYHQIDKAQAGFEAFDDPSLHWLRRTVHPSPTIDADSYSDALLTDSILMLLEQRELTLMWMKCTTTQAGSTAIRLLDAAVFCQLPVVVEGSLPQAAYYRSHSTNWLWLRQALAEQQEAVEYWLDDILSKS